MQKTFAIIGIWLMVISIPLEAQNKRFQRQQRWQERNQITDTVKLVEMVWELDSVLRYIEMYLDEKEQQEKLQKLLDEAEKLSQAETKERLHTGTKFHSGVRQQQGLNPNLSLTGDFFIGKSTEDHEFIATPGDQGYGTNGIMMREVELGIEAALDPYTRGKSFISVSDGEIAVEEAYIEVLNLPLNLNLKLGIFAPEFGPFNRYHDHALPQFDRPRALVNYFTTGQLKGVGVAANFMLPRLLWADASTLEVGALNSGIESMFCSENFLDMQYVGHLKNFYELGINNYVEYSLNTVIGRNHPVEQLYTSISSLGLGYKWIPGGNAKYRTFDVKAELFYGLYQTPADALRSKGFYASVQNKMGVRWWLSGRLGYSEQPTDPGQYEWDYTLALDFWQSEFVFFRLQYQYNNRNRWMPEDIGDIIPNDHSLILQVCWAMGPHRHEAY